MEEIAEPILSFFDEKPSDLIREHRQFYLMVNAISRRVRQLQTGDRALALPANGNREAFYIAQEEFLQDKLLVTPRTVGLYEFYEEDSAPDLDALLGMDDGDDAFDGGDDDE